MGSVAVESMAMVSIVGKKASNVGHNVQEMRRNEEGRHWSIVLSVETLVDFVLCHEDVVGLLRREHVDLSKDTLATDYDPSVPYN